MGMYSNVKNVKSGGSDTGHKLKLGKLTYAGTDQEMLEIHFPTYPILMAISQVNIDPLDFVTTNLFEPIPQTYFSIITALSGTMGIEISAFYASDNTLIINDENKLLNDAGGIYHVYYLYEE